VRFTITGGQQHDGSQASQAFLGTRHSYAIVSSRDRCLHRRDYFERGLYFDTEVLITTAAEAVGLLNATPRGVRVAVSKSNQQ